MGKKGDVNQIVVPPSLPYSLEQIHDKITTYRANHPWTWSGIQNNSAEGKTLYNILYNLARHNTETRNVSTLVTKLGVPFERWDSEEHQKERFITTFKDFHKNGIRPSNEVTTHNRDLHQRATRFYGSYAAAIDAIFGEGTYLATSLRVQKGTLNHKPLITSVSKELANRFEQQGYVSYHQLADTNSTLFLNLFRALKITPGRKKKDYTTFLKQYVIPELKKRGHDEEQMKRFRPPAKGAEDTGPIGLIGELFSFAYLYLTGQQNLTPAFTHGFPRLQLYAPHNISRKSEPTGKTFPDIALEHRTHWNIHEVKAGLYLPLSAAQRILTKYHNDPLDPIREFDGTKKAKLTTVHIHTTGIAPSAEQLLRDAQLKLLLPDDFRETFPSNLRALYDTFLQEPLYASRTNLRPTVEATVLEIVPDSVRQVINASLEERLEPETTDAAF